MNRLFAPFPFRRVAAFFSATALSLAAASAQDVRVTKAGGGKSALDLSDFAGGGGEGALLRQTLEQDLARSGWFTFAGRGGGEFRLLGAAETGGRVEATARLLNTGTGQTLLNKTLRGDAGAARRVAHQLADEIVFAATGRKGFAASRLLLVGSRTGRKEIYLCDSDGANLRQLTQDKTVSLYPRWSPDGRRFTYTSYLQSAPDVYLVDLESGSRRRVAQYPGLNAGGAISPDGRQIALILSRDGNPELYVRPLDGGAPTRLTRTLKAAESSPTWSPDGRQIAFVSDMSGSPQLYLVDRGGGAPARLTSRGAQNVAPHWGPEGVIAYASLVGGKFQIALLDPRTREQRALPLDFADWEDPAWARDGRHLAAVRTANYRAAIYLIDTLGDKPVLLTDSQGDWYSPAWSP